MQIQISWLLKKPTDLDLHCLQKQGISGFSRTRVNVLTVLACGDRMFIYFELPGCAYLSPLLNACGVHYENTPIQMY